MQIFIKHDRTYALEVEASDDARVVKLLLATKIGFVPESWHVYLIYHGKALEDGRTLENYGIKAGDTVQCRFAASLFQKEAFEKFSALHKSQIKLYVLIEKSGKRVLWEGLASLTVWDLKAQLTHHWRPEDLLPSDLIASVSKHCILDDGDSLSECGLQHEATVTLSSTIIVLKIRCGSALLRNCELVTQLEVLPRRTVGWLKTVLVPEARPVDLSLHKSGRHLSDEHTLEQEGLRHEMAVEVRLAAPLKWLDRLHEKRKDESDIDDGAVLMAVTETPIWESAVSWNERGNLLPGQHALVHGPLQRVGKYRMVCIRPKGAIQVDNRVKRVESQAVACKDACSLLSALPYSNRYTQFQICELEPSSIKFSILRQSLILSLVQHRNNLHDKQWCSVARILIEKIEEVFNPRLLEKYTLELQHMTGLNRAGCSRNIGIKYAMRLEHAFGAELNEVLLYHGAKSEDLDLICEAGFDPRRGGRATGRNFGCGTYLAENFSKADLYSGPRPFVRHKGSMSVMIARVALGEAYGTKVPLPNIMMPPERKGQRHPFDSVWALDREEGGCVDHHEYVVYRDAQLLPVFRVTYRHDDSCTCARCAKPCHSL